MILFHNYNMEKDDSILFLNVTYNIGKTCKVIKFIKKLKYSNWWPVLYWVHAHWLYPPALGCLYMLLKVIIVFLQWGAIYCCTKHGHKYFPQRTERNPPPPPQHWGKLYHGPGSHCFGPFLRPHLICTHWECTHLIYTLERCPIVRFSTPGIFVIFTP